MVNIIVVVNCYYITLLLEFFILLLTYATVFCWFLFMVVLFCLEVYIKMFVVALLLLRKICYLLHKQRLGYLVFTFIYWGLRTIVNVSLFSFFVLNLSVDFVNVVIGWYN